MLKTAKSNVMKKLFISFLLLVSLFSSNAQQFPESNFYSRNLYLINPSFTGYITGISGYVSAQSPLNAQFGEIRNFGVGIYTPIEKSYFGIGGKLNYDKRGIYEAFYGDVSLSYQIVIDRAHVISVGTDIGLVNRSFDTGELNEFVNLDDPVLNSDYYFKTNMKLGFGVSYVSRFLEIGIALPHLIESSEQANTQANLYTGYRHQVPNSDWLIKPNFLYSRYTDNSNVVDANIMVQKDDTFWLQLGYRSTNNILASLGFMVQEMEIDYSFSPYIGSDDLPYETQHQVMLIFNISKSKKYYTHIVNKKNRR